VLETWTYINSHWSLIGQLILQHLEMVILGCGIGVAIGVSLGIFISEEGREGIADVVLYLAETMMTVPSLALFGLLIPILTALHLPALGLLPAVIALIAYGLLPILRNTYVAVREVDPAIIEAGRGMGMNKRQLMYKIKLPLAVPVIMAGLRNAIIYYNEYRYCGNCCGYRSWGIGSSYISRNKEFSFRSHPYWSDIYLIYSCNS